MSIKELASRYRYPLLLLLAGVAVLIVYNRLLQLDQQTFLYPDAGNYLEASRNLFLYHRGHPYRPILMAFLNGLPYLFGGGDAAVLEWSFWLNAGCWLATALLLLLQLRPILGEKRAFWCAGCFFLLPGSAVLAFHLLAESIFTLCLVGFVGLVQSYKASGNLRHLVWALALVTASMLVKPASMFLAIAAVLWFAPTLWKLWRRRIAWPLYGSFLLIAIQVGGLRYEFGNYTISYIDGVTLHNYLLSRAVCEAEGKTYSQEHNPRAEYLFSLTPMEQKKLATNDLEEQLRHRFPYVVKAYMGNLSDNTSHGAYAIKDCQNERHTPAFERGRTILYTVSIWQNRVLTVIGFTISLLVLVRWRRFPFYVVVAAFIVVYTVALSGISCGQGDRFMVPLYPFYLLLLATIWKYRRLIQFSVRLRKASRSHT
ncbi:MULTISPECIES: hypothetical protein [unclassified Flavobacterium]|uniref:hypothetical protein n=1 Tax=unclassified Flavobacterium TaxID=196869 RepID=UPI001F131110|nr:MULTISPECIES: hypothetical protein [unclassified Flavobacterium]UMY65530.1 hypothetical protein MKO97_13620 [Flavobacterium sp. HJ-32-4]